MDSQSLLVQGQLQLPAAHHRLLASVPLEGGVIAWGLAAQGHRVPQLQGRQGGGCDGGWGQLLCEGGMEREGDLNPSKTTAHLGERGHTDLPPLSLSLLQK